MCQELNTTRDHIYTFKHYLDVQTVSESTLIPTQLSHIDFF